MRAHFSRLLLVSTLVLTTMVVQSRAQKAADAHEPESEFDVAFTFNAASANQVTGARFWMEGAGIQVHDRFLGGLGMVADIAGTHTGGINSSGVGLDMITATFGPRYTWHPTHQRFDLYGQGLVGDAFAFNSVFPAQGGAVTSDYGLAVLAGGGMNWRARPHLNVRVFEADWLRTQLPNTTTNVQNNLRFGAGVVFRF